ncbi:helix-turn-helix domain-containing protein [Thiospirochaeta perfilievii]|nr:helix-turn-helix domain-containing protein [Thiospirochaeta perfilievii]
MNDEINLANVGKLLSHPARIRILKLLSTQGALTSNKIVDQIPLARTTVLQHISVLTKDNWVETESDGTTITYLLNNQLIKSLLPNVETLLKQCGKKQGKLKNPIKILFLCTGNSCRSQMAEGFINKQSETYNVKSFSAGTVPSKEIHPLAISVMKEKGIDISKQYPKSIKEYVGDDAIDIVIFVCDKAEKECPYLFPFSKSKIFMPFKDPVSFKGTKEDTVEVFRDVRDQIEIKLQKLLEEFPEL